MSEAVENLLNKMFLKNFVEICSILDHFEDTFVLVLCPTNAIKWR